MKKLIPILFVFVFMFSLVSAASCGDNNLGTFKQGDAIQLRQTCDDCSYVNLSSISYPNGTTINFDLFMTKTGKTFNYTFSSSTNGDYFYSVYGDKGGGLESETFCFEVTPSGSIINSGSGITLIGSLLLMLIIAIVLFVIASRSENTTPRIIFYSLSAIVFIMSILYSVVTIQQTLFGFESIQSGIETFWFVMKMLVGVGILALIIIVILIMIKAWKIKRGYRDE